MTIKIVDLFAGPGGLGEGFSQLENGSAFKILISAEMETTARKTLRLRSFFRLIRNDVAALKSYYEFCNGDQNEYSANEFTKSAWEEAGQEAQQLELGNPDDNEKLDAVLKAKLDTKAPWVLIGGPPCQAYSLVGRSRNLGKPLYRPEDDPRFFLYREYFRIVKEREPPVFVMENVEGILTAKVGGEQIFPTILKELSSAGENGTRLGYRIHSLVTDTHYEHGKTDLNSIDLRDFIVKSDLFGIPQARHRVILLGVRTDIIAKFDRLQPVAEADRVHVNQVIHDLPKVRSRLNKQADSSELWAEEVRKNMWELAEDALLKGDDRLSFALRSAADQVRDDLHPGSRRASNAKFPQR
jgi:DNA (cytosine-5)-methyltransferase 1